MRASVVALLLVIAACAAPAQAHTRSESFSHWQATGDGHYQVRARVRAIDLTRLGLHPDTPDFTTRAAAHLAARLTLAHAAGSCPVEAEGASLAGGWIQARWQLRCPTGERLVLHSGLLPDQTGHLHMVSLTDEGGRTRHKALVGSTRDWTLGVAGYASGPAAARAFLAVGFRHIASGWDHLAFLLGLLLLSRRLSGLAVLVTGFTLGHSITLAAAALGLLRPATATVEAMIALSIALVAAEYALGLGARRGLPLAVAGVLALAALFAPLTISALSVAGMALFAGAYLAAQDGNPAPQALRVIVATAFGLFHGFGFGGSLAQLHWPEAQAAWALLGFNLGVEVGQLLVLALAWPLIKALARQRPAVPAALNAALAGAGSYWFVVRAFA